MREQPVHVAAPELTQVSPDGLRYISKSQGTDFPGAFAATMSCFLCGKHVPRSSLQGFRVAGSMQFRCKVPCN
jgi:hypothetical protein